MVVHGLLHSAQPSSRQHFPKLSPCTMRSAMSALLIPHVQATPQDKPIPCTPYTKDGFVRAVHVQHIRTFATYISICCVINIDIAAAHSKHCAPIQTKTISMLYENMSSSDLQETNIS